MKESIKKFTLMCDGTVYIKTNRREYKRTLKRNISDEEYISFKNQEYTKEDMKRYECEVLY